MSVISGILAMLSILHTAVQWCDLYVHNNQSSLISKIIVKYSSVSWQTSAMTCRPHFKNLCASHASCCERVTVQGVKVHWFSEALIIL